MHELSSWIAQHGYVALAFGALLEGETVLLLAGVAAHSGLLQWHWVVAIGAAAGFSGDTVLFALGRWQWPRIDARWPMLARHVRPRLDRWIARYAGLTVVGMRFAYGLRIAGPLLLGTTSLRWPRFALFNALGATAWAAAFAGLGALLGASAVALLHVLHRLGAELLLPMALLLAFVAAMAWQRAARNVSPVAAQAGRNGRAAGALDSADTDGAAVAVRRRNAPIQKTDRECKMSRARGDAARPESAKKSSRKEKRPKR